MGPIYAMGGQPPHPPLYVGCGGANLHAAPRTALCTLRQPGRATSRISHPDPSKMVVVSTTRPLATMARLN